MEINDTLVDRLAALAMLRFNNDEKTTIKSDLEKMIRFVEKLNEVDTAGVEPLLHISGNVNIFRKDTVAGMCSREEALKNAQVKDERFFKVPKVINKP